MMRLKTTSEKGTERVGKAGKWINSIRSTSQFMQKVKSTHHGCGATWSIASNCIRQCKFKIKETS